MLNPMKRASIIAIILFALCGLSVAFYLAAHEADNTPLLCTAPTLSNCNIVATGRYATLLGIPVAQYGVAFYVVIFVLAALALIWDGRLLRRALQALASIGLVVSVCLTLVEIFVIHTFCIYCLSSAILTVLIFIASLLIEPVRTLLRRSPPANPPLLPPHRSTPFVRNV